MFSPDELVADTKAMFLTARAYGEPSPKFQGHPGATEFYYRVLERQMELVDAIDRLLSTGLVQASLALLRVMLENAAILVWVAKDPEVNLQRFQNSEKPNAIPKLHAIMGDIGWSREYREIYGSLLSLFVHPRPSGLDLYKTTMCAEKGFVPTPLVDTYICENEYSKPEIFHVFDASADTLIADHGPFISLKMYDIALSSLTLCHDEYPESHRWWPSRTILYFDKIVMSDADASSVLWRSVRSSLATVRVEGKIYGDAVSEDVS